MKLFQFNNWTEHEIPSYHLSFFLGKTISFLRIGIDCDRHSMTNRYFCFSFSSCGSECVENVIEIRIGLILFASVGFEIMFFGRRLEVDGSKNTWAKV